MPGSEPDEEPASDGWVHHGIVSSVDGKTTYAIEYKCYCDQFDHPDKAEAQMKSMIDAIVARTAMSIVNTTDATLPAGTERTKVYAGKEIKFESDSRVAIYHIYLAGDMSYALSVVSEKPNQMPEAVNGFFSSFRLGVDPQLIKNSEPPMLGGVPGGTLGGIPDKTLSRSEGVLKGNAIKLVTPRYPPLARQARLQGKVEIDIIIDEEGKVIRAFARCGHPLFVAVALQAARDSIFKPTTLAGVPVKVQGVLTYNFAF